MNAIFTKISEDELAVRAILCPALRLPFLGSKEQKGWNKDHAGCVFETMDVNGRKFLFNANRHYVTKTGRRLWNGKTWLGRNVQMPAPDYNLGCMFQVIFNEDYTACVLAQRDNMTFDGYKAYIATEFETIDLEKALIQNI